MIEIGAVANQILERLRAKIIAERVKQSRAASQSRARTILDYENGKISLDEAAARWDTPVPRLVTSDGDFVDDKS